MKLHNLAALVCALCGMTAAQAQPAAGRFTTPIDGTFTLNPDARITFTKGLEPLAEYLGDHLGLQLSDPRYTGDLGIVLLLEPIVIHGASMEEYKLDITPERITIRAPHYSGVFNGIQALFRLLPPEVYAKNCPLPTQLDCGRYRDTPRFGYRGMMLDVARTWIDYDAVKRYIDLFAYHNINKLHMHLADDEGWRIEIKSHPELTEIGAYRGGDSPVRSVYGKWGEKYGGFYTQEQMRSLIEYAAVRNIEIIPEIDLPGHSRNIASVHPEIRCPYPPDTVSTNGYDYRSAWCVAREENYALLTDILTEVCKLFPTKYINVGGDEVDFEQWKRCPDCQALMRKKGMTDPHQLEDLFMSRMIDILKANGKQPGVWNEAARTGDLTRESLVYGWQDVKECLAATAKGYKTVVMPAQYFYFDMRQSPYEEGHDWAAIFDARKTYEFNFEKLGFTAEHMHNVAGVEGTFFSEAYVSHEPEKPDYLDYLLFPRVSALSRIAWSGNSEGWEAYYKELVSKHYDRMAAMGIIFRLFPPKMTYKEGTFTLTTDDGSDIFYVIGDSPEEHRYTKPLKVDKPHLYRFYTRYKTAHSPYVADRSYYRTITPAVTLTTSMGESERFPYTNVSEYKNQARTRRACRQKDWVLYTFDAPVKCREMYLQTGNKQLPKTIITFGYAEVSYDGVKFERAGDLEKGSITLRPDRAIKAVRLVSTCDDNGTPWVAIQPPQIKPVL